MKTTINQLVQELKDIQDSHLQLNDFFWGDFGKASSRNDLRYPLMCCYYPNGSVLNNLTPINLIVVIADKIDKANNETGENPTQGNLTEVESDTLQVTRDIYNVINKSRRWQQLARVNSVTFNKFIERGKDETAGHYMTISLYIKDTTSICNLPMEGYDFDQPIPTPADCDPATVENSDVSYSVQVSSGGSLTLPDEDLTINGNAFLTKPSVQDQDIELLDQDTNPITPTSIVGNVVTVTLPVGASVGATLMKTGQTTSYATGDDGDLQEGRETDFFTLGSNNPFGNTNRFTDELGGGTYANNIVIDWSTYNGTNVLGWYNVFQVDGDWIASVAAALTKSVGTFTSGWRMPNCNELNSIINRGITPTLNYAPFNQNVNLNIYVSTTRSDISTQSCYFILGSGLIGGFTKTSNFGGRQLVCRNFTVTGTTLT